MRSSDLIFSCSFVFDLNGNANFFSAKNQRPEGRSLCLYTKFWRFQFEKEKKRQSIVRNWIEREMVKKRKKKKN